MKEKNAEYISFIKKILIIIGFIFLSLLTYKILNIIVMLVLSLFLCILFSPFLNKLNKWKINDLTGIILIFIGILLVVMLIMLLIIPLIVNQIIILFSEITNYVSQLLDTYNTSGIEGFGLPLIAQDFVSSLNVEQVLTLIKENSTQISSFLGANIKNFITSGAGIIFTVGSFIFNLVFVFLFTFFIVLERKDIRQLFYAILPKKLSEYIFDNEKEVIHILTIWMKGQMILGICMFFLTLFGLLVLKIFGINVPGILSLALIALFMEFIPYIGTFLSFFIALSISLGLGLNGFIGILIVYLIIQQIEGNFLVPYIMGKTLALSPFIVLISMTIGGALFGIVGVIFTIPVISITKVFLRPYIIKREKENKFIKIKPLKKA
ncbi:MAG: AI-2E family transporter [Candidatus Gracilibacteria bacterium]|nr:AI-2E family transporter [Candidatus Gracilibacteria bacterium]